MCKGRTTAIVLPARMVKRLSGESRKLTGMMWQELVAVREVLKSLKIFSALGEESTLSDLGMHSAPSSVFRILGASPKFKIVDFYG